MYNRCMGKIIEFFKQMNLYDEKVFENIKKNTKIIDKPYEEIMDFVGCFKREDSVKLILPTIKSIKDELIYVHEYTHILLDDESEIFPNIMEAIYTNYYLKNEKKNVIDMTYNEIENSDSIDHIIGKKVKLMFINR